MKIKHTIGGILIVLGMFFIFGAVGNLDYLGECRIRYGGAELFEMLLRCLGGFAGIALGGFLCRDVDYIEDRDDPNVEYDPYEWRENAEYWSEREN